MSIIKLMPQLHEEEDSKSIVVRGFRLVFHWNGEQWVHRLEFGSPDQGPVRLLAASVEGNPERDDPKRVVSPAYQQLQFQESGDSLQALLVGQSGPHHFSAVFTVEAEIIESEIGRNGVDPLFVVHVTVDIADRCRSPVEFLASTYTLEAGSGELREARESLVSWDLQSEVLNFIPEPPAHVSLAEAGRRGTRVQALSIPQAGNLTHRLVYLWLWEENYPAQSENPN